MTVRDFALIGLKYLILSSVMALSIHLGILYFILMCVLLITTNIFGAIYPDNTMDHVPNVKSSELQDFLGSLGDELYEIKKRDVESGAVIHRVGGPNIYIIPKHTNPEMATNESKAVISHEFSHVNNNDRIKTAIYDVTSVILLGGLAGLVANLVSILILVIFSLVLLPIFKNYLKHKFEYRADKFAASVVDSNSVQNRLRRNTHLEPESIRGIPYTRTHPSVQTRMDRIHQSNIERSLEKDESKG